MVGVPEVKALAHHIRGRGERLLQLVVAGAVQGRLAVAVAVRVATASQTACHQHKVIQYGKGICSVYRGLMIG